MDWLRANYDRALALAAALFLILCAGFIFLGASGFRETLGALRSAPLPNNNIPADQAGGDCRGDGSIAEALAVDFQRTLRALRAGKAFHRPGWSARDLAKHAPPSACA